MGFLGDLGNGPTLMTPTIFWALLAVTVAVGIALGIGTCIAAGKARDEALGARNEPVHDVALSCHIDGHYYAAYGITGGGAPHAVTTCPP